MKRPLLLSVAAIFVGVGVLFAGAAPASALAANPLGDIGSAGGDIDVLPSTIDSALTGFSDASRTSQLTAFLYQASKSPAFWQTIAEWQSTSGAETSAALTEAETGALPAEAEGASTVALGAGGASVLTGAGTAIGGYMIGTSIVNGTAQLFGVDADGTVCQATAGGGVGGFLVRLADGAQCGGDPYAKGYTKNAGQTGATELQFCGNSGAGSNSVARNDCATFQGEAATTRSNPYEGGASTAMCFSIVASPDQDLTGSTMYFLGAGGAYLTQNTASSYTRTGFSDCPGMTTDTKIYEFVISNKSAASFAGAAWEYDYDKDNVDHQTTQGSADPNRTIECDVTGSDGNSYPGTPITYTEGTTSVLPTPTCEALPAGVTPSEVKVTGGLSGKPSTLSDNDVSQGTQDWMKNYPGCTTHSVCELTLFKVGTDGSTLTACEDGSQGCDGWYTDPNKAKDYTCEYGIPGDQRVVDLSECNVYQSRYSTTAQATGNTLADPSTGKALTNPSPTADPSSDAAVSNRPVTGDDTNRDCFGGGTFSTFNPLTWVMQPVICALEDVFVPSTSTVTNAKQTLRTDIDQSGIGQLTGDAHFLGVVSFAEGCGGIPLDIDFVPGVGVHSHLLAACPGDTLAPVAATTKTILSGVAVTASLMACLRYAGMIFGFGGLGSRIQSAVNAQARAEQKK